MSEPGATLNNLTSSKVLKMLRMAPSCLAVAPDLAEKAELRESEVAVYPVPKIPGVNHLEAAGTLSSSVWRAYRDETRFS
jgi:hypothetical protein